VGATVTFRLFAAARAAAGTADVRLPGGPTSEVLGRLVAGLPPRFAEVLAVSSLVSDGTRLDPASAELLADGAVVDVLPPFAGG
jgi:molybdopterin converting factor small subunit